MAEAKHTPGPWREGQDGNLRVYGPDGQGEHSGLIAIVFKGRGNVHLIAAAPDYHKAATDNYGGWIGPELLDAAAEHCDDSIIADLLRARAAADRAAIAKAKGTK